MEKRIAQLDHVEAARKEAERVRLRAEFAAAISKVYGDAIKEDEEQYLGSDDPDSDDVAYNRPEPERHLQGLNPHETFVKEKQLSSPRAQDAELRHSTDLTAKQLNNTVNPKTPEFTLQATPLPQGVVNSSGCTANQDFPGETSTASKVNREPPAGLWEKMELRMMQPPPAITPFVGDPARRFRANFRDQVETRASLTAGVDPGF